MTTTEMVIEIIQKMIELKRTVPDDSCAKIFEHILQLAPFRYAYGAQEPYKIYLAGPQVFRKDALEHAAWQREICTKYGFIGIHPMDNNIDFTDKTYKTAEVIYHGDCRQIFECDITVADCNSFRGACIDDGTAYELGASNIGFWMPTYGYIDKLLPANEIIQQRFPCPEKWNNMLVDADGYLLVDDFETSINLMMQCGMTDHGGRLIEGNFEACIRAIREDIDSGKLKF